MPRKRSASGRSKPSTIQSNIRLQTEKINKMIRSLEKGKNYGTYKSKELIRFAKQNDNVTLKKSRGSKHHRLTVQALREATFGKLAIISKKFKEFIQSKAFTNVGIYKIRKRTMKKLAETLTGIKGEKVTRKDLEMFYDIINYKTDEIISKIGPSEFFAMVTQARDTSMDQEQWVEMLNNYVSINNEAMRQASEYLYNKYIK